MLLPFKENPTFLSMVQQPPVGHSPQWATAPSGPQPPVGHNLLIIGDFKITLRQHIR